MTDLNKLDALNSIVRDINKVVTNAQYHFMSDFHTDFAGCKATFGANIITQSFVFVNNKEGISVDMVKCRAINAILNTIELLESAVEILRNWNPE